LLEQDTCFHFVVSSMLMWTPRWQLLSCGLALLRGARVLLVLLKYNCGLCGCLCWMWWGTIFVKVKVYIGPEALHGVELATGGSKDAMTLTDVFMSLSKECGIISIRVLPNEKVDIVNECIKGLLW